MTPSPPTRSEILGELFDDFKQLKQISGDIGSNKKMLTEILKYQVYIIQVRSQIGKSIICGLKDEELELRLRDLEGETENWNTYST